MDQPAESRPDCMRCRSFYVTYDPARPYGCRAFGFKSLRVPRDEVRLSSGNECHLFEQKPTPPPTERS
jgi:hypothetical protein